MSEKEIHPRDPAQLRRRAAEMARREAALAPKNIDGLTHGESLRKLHELRVHQIELEMQNEELLRTHVELDAARARYFDFYDLAPVGFFTVSEQGLILEANLTAASRLGVARDALAQQRLTSFIFPQDEDIYYLHCKQLFETGEVEGCDLRMLEVDGTTFWARLESTAARAEGKPVCRVVMTDITRRKRAETDLRATNTQLAAIYANAPLILLVIDEQLRVREANHLASRFAGREAWIPDVPPGEALGCMNALADPRGCGHGLSCGQCTLRQAISGALTGGSNSEGIEAWLPLSVDGEDEQRCLLVSTTAMKFNGSTRVLVCAQDITTRKRAEEAQRQSERLYRGLFENLLNGFALHEIEGGEDGRAMDYRFVAVNPAFERMTGLKAEDLLGRTVREVMPGAEPYWIEPYAKMAVTGEPASFEHYSAEPRKHFQVTAFQPAPNQLACIFADITARKQAEEALRESELQYRNLADCGQALIWTSKPDKKCDYFNQPWLDFTGRPLAEREMGDGWAASVCPEDLERCIETYTRAFDRRERFSMDHRMRRHDGEFRWIQDAGTPRYDGHGNFLGYICHCLDITERQRNEEALRQSVCRMESAVQQQAILLKEIHHRVKNNLAVTASLLSMKADGCGPEAKLALEESQQRIHSIALVHEYLYANDSLDRIDFGEYARDLVQGVYSAFGGEQKRIGLDLQLDPVELGIDRAVPCALILNELLSNALKYAFADGRTGRILVSFRQPEQGCCELAVEDDGVGLPDGALLGQNKSLGLRIVRILTTQLDGSVEQQTCLGTRIVLRFPAAG